MNQKAHVACNVNHLYENERILKSQPVTYTVKCKCGIISETVPDRVVDTIMQTTNSK